MNRPNAHLRLDGALIDAFDGVDEVLGWSGSVHTIEIGTGGAPGEVAIVGGEPLYASGVLPGSTTPAPPPFQPQAININLNAPGGLTFAFGLAAGTPATMHPVALPSMLTATVRAPFVPVPTWFSAQVFTLDPTFWAGVAIGGCAHGLVRPVAGYVEPGGTHVGAEGFESIPLGPNSGPNWQTTPGTVDWRVHTNGTPSVGTGPQGAWHGTRYLYCEVSGSNGSAVFGHEMTLPVTATAPQFVCYSLHLIGDQSGTLEVEQEVPPGSGSWVTMDTVSGTQPRRWALREAPLALASNPVRLRFRYTGGGGFRGDCCIDAVTICQ